MVHVKAVVVAVSVAVTEAANAAAHLVHPVADLPAHAARASILLERMTAVSATTTAVIPVTALVLPTAGEYLQ